LTAERAVTRYKEGRPYRVWVCPHGTRNEILDLTVYALAARASIPIRLRGKTQPTAAPSQRPVVAQAEERGLVDRGEVPKPTPRPPMMQQWRGRRVVRSTYMD